MYNRNVQSTGVNISILIGIGMHQLEQNCGLLQPIILPCTVGIRMVVVIKSCSAVWNNHVWGWIWLRMGNILIHLIKKIEPLGWSRRTQLLLLQIRQGLAFQTLLAGGRWWITLLSALFWMRGEGELPITADWKYLAWSESADWLWFLECHDYWCWNCSFELRQRTTRGKTSTYAGRLNVDLFAILPRRRETFYVKFPN